MQSLDLIRKYTKHDNIKLVNSGNAAILFAFYLVKKLGKKKIIVPDQGGWFSYKKYPRIFDLDVVEIKTNYGVINVDNLKPDSDSALIINSFAGYSAEQPLKDISKECKENDSLLIEDVSGSISDKTLCNGLLSDIIVGSFGKWKLVNSGKGGFISSNFDLDCEIYSALKFSDNEGKLLKLLKNVPKRLDYFFELNKKIKSDLSSFEIIHKNKRGINVVVKYRNEEEKNKVIEYCKKNNYEFVFCPKYIKVKEKAISIEVKRINK